MEFCPEPGCKFVAKTKAGLSSHLRSAHGIKRGPNRRAAERMLSILRGQGWLEDVDSARVQIIRGMSEALDRDDSNANMWRTYREAVEDLMRMDEDADDDLRAALAEINSAAPMGYKAPPGA